MAKNMGKTRIRRNRFGTVMMELSCRAMSAKNIDIDDARPYAVNGIDAGGGGSDPFPFATGLDGRYFRYSCPSTLNLSTNAAICAELSMNRSRDRRSTVDRHTESGKEE